MTTVFFMPIIIKNFYARPNPQTYLKGLIYSYLYYNTRMILQAHIRERSEKYNMFHSFVIYNIFISYLGKASTKWETPEASAKRLCNNNNPHFNLRIIHIIKVSSQR